MVNSKPFSVNKNDPIGPVETIVSKSVANLRNIPTKQILSTANRTDWQQLITVAVFYRAAQRTLRMVMKLQD